MMAFVSPLLFLQAQINKHPSALKKVHIKEIPPSRLPKSITNYISKNLPNATITMATKQKRNPDAAYIVKIDIKTRHHTLIFNKGSELVKLDAKRLEATTVKKK